MTKVHVLWRGTASFGTAPVLYHEQREDLHVFLLMIRKTGGTK